MKAHPASAAERGRRDCLKALGAAAGALALPGCLSMGTPLAQRSYTRRTETVRRIPGLVAFWDFVRREDGPRGRGRFIAFAGAGDDRSYALEPRNVSRDFWQEGAEVTMADFPLLGRGPFGQAVQFRDLQDRTRLPLLMVPRSALHDSPLDIKGTGKSLSMVVWLLYQGGEHAIAGIWHEGTDVSGDGDRPKVVVRGRRQFGLFAGLSANPGAAGAHLSENGVGSFGDRYARHLALTRERMARITPDNASGELDARWSVAGFVYDNTARTVTSYVNGAAGENWIEQPATNGFYKHAAQAWRAAKRARDPGLPREPRDAPPGVPADQYYEPPETTPRSEVVTSETAETRTVLRTYEFTKVSTTYRKDRRGALARVAAVDLVALKVNPYWFGHDIYAPATPDEGGPFTIGRVIRGARQGALSAYIGGVAVYDRALSAAQMQTLAGIGRSGTGPDREPPIIKMVDVVGAPLLP